LGTRLKIKTIPKLKMNFNALSKISINIFNENICT
jgi:hypothetical protein